MLQIYERVRDLMQDRIEHLAFRIGFGEGAAQGNHLLADRTTAEPFPGLVPIHRSAQDHQAVFRHFFEEKGLGVREVH